MNGLKTTVIGSIAKPSYLKIPTSVANGRFNANCFQEYSSVMTDQHSQDVQDELERATKEIMELQIRCGLTVITDGELKREHYAYHFCRRFNGFDFENSIKKVTRNGAWEGLLPKIVSKIFHKEQPGFMAREWKSSQDMCETPLKITVPGPMTIMDTFYDDFYNDEERLLEDLTKCINIELKLLAKAGCKEIQIDEPVLARYPQKGLKLGINYLSACFADLPKEVFKTVHVCCGYPFYLDQKDYEKADKGAYLKLASRLDDAGFDALSIEDAHRRNDPELFRAFKKIKIVLGVIDVVRSRVESVEEIREHISDVLKYIPAERLIIAPDCGLIYLPLELAEEKLTNMVKAAKYF